MTAYLEWEQLSHSGQVCLELLQERYFLDEIKEALGRGLGLTGGLALGESIS